jgi:hypothetical protein
MLFWTPSACPNCGADAGGPHAQGCAGEPIDFDEAIRECRRRGWAVTDVPGEGLRPCRPDEPGAYVDLDRYRASRRRTERWND